MATKKEVSNKVTVEEWIAQLEVIEKMFAQPDLDLAVAIQEQEKALKIAEAINSYLDSAESKLKQIDIASLETRV